VIGMAKGDSAAATTPPGSGRSRLKPVPKGHARQFVENRRAFVRKTRGLFQIGPQSRDLPFQPVERRRRLLAGLLLPLYGVIAESSPNRTLRAVHKPVAIDFNFATGFRNKKCRSFQSESNALIDGLGASQKCSLPRALKSGSWNLVEPLAAQWLAQNPMGLW